jgi:hypothetical protein
LAAKTIPSQAIMAKVPGKGMIFYGTGFFTVQELVIIQFLMHYVAFFV